jgi:L-arabinokinase
MNLVFYISGHGFGHASRALEVVNEIGCRRPDARVVVRSSVAPRFLESSLDAGAALQPCDTDIGVVQRDSLTLDEDETARQAARFYEGFARRVDEEAAVLQMLNASVVVGDIPPLAFAAAARAGVPSLALGNFTWDWIYEGYPQFERLAPGVLDIIRGAYGGATQALRLPLHGGFAPMQPVVRDIPLIARHSRRRREDIRAALAIDAGELAVLASFGGHGLGLDYHAIARRHRFRLIVTDQEAPGTEFAPGAATGGRLLRLAMADLPARGLRYADLVAAADVVVTKPGYGIVSECIANGAALLYTSRGHFREHDVFVAEMPRLLRCRFVSQDDLRAGRWADAIDALLAQPAPAIRPATDGAAVAAGAVMAMGDRIGPRRAP